MKLKTLVPLGILISASGLALAAGPSAPTAKPGCARPVYPTGESAEATLLAHLTVTNDGTVSGVTFDDDPGAAFAEAARTALSKWTFSMPAGIERATFTTPVYFTPPDGAPVAFSTAPDGAGPGLPGDEVVVNPANREFWSTIVFRDVVLRGEVRVPPGVRGSFFIRDGYYRIPLNGDTTPSSHTGKILQQYALSPANSTFDEDASRAFVQRDGWQPFEIESIGSTMRVRLGGRTISEASDLQRHLGTFAVAATEGEIGLRHVRAIRKDDFRDTLPLSVTNPDASEIQYPAVVAPRLVRQMTPQYTPNAMRARIEGRVALEAIIEKDGGVGPVRLVHPLDPGLDASAVDSLRQWTFVPGTRDGAPVRVRVNVEMSFTLRDGR